MQTPTPLTLRLSVAADAEAVHALQSRWAIEIQDASDQPDGFLLTHAAISLPDVRAIADAGHLAVAYAGDRLVGYFLIDAVSEDPFSRRAAGTVDALKAAKRIEGSARVAPRSQACVDRDYQGQGLYGELIRTLATQLPDHDLVFGVVPRAHPKLEVHLRKGYREVSADADWIYVVLDVAEVSAGPSATPRAERP